MSCFKYRVLKRAMSFFLSKKTKEVTEFCRAIYKTEPGIFNHGYFKKKKEKRNRSCKFFNLLILIIGVLIWIELNIQIKRQLLDQYLELNWV